MPLGPVPMTTAMSDRARQSEEARLTEGPPQAKTRWEFGHSEPVLEVFIPILNPIEPNDIYAANVSGTLSKRANMKSVGYDFTRETEKFLYGADRIAYVSNVDTFVGYRKRGWAMMLLDIFAYEMAMNGARRIYLSVSLNNLEYLSAFYGKLGYVEYDSGFRPGYEARQSNPVMAKKLDPRAWANRAPGAFTKKQGVYQR